MMHSCSWFQHIKMDATTLTGAPLISFEATDDRSSLCVNWRHVSSAERPTRGYILYLNQQKCGDEVKPHKDSDRCKVIVGGCNARTPYHVVVGALAEGTYTNDFTAY